MRSTAPAKTKVERLDRGDRLDRLVVGSRVFYPAHGVATVAGMEKREFGEAEQEFYVLTLDRGVRLLLPTSKVDAAGVRALVSPTKARELMRSVADEPTVDVTPWRERTTSYADALRQGAPEGYTDILRQLLFRSRSDKLSAIERRLLETARGYFVGEIGAVLELSSEQIDASLLSQTNGTVVLGEPKQ